MNETTSTPAGTCYRWRPGAGGTVLVLLHGVGLDQSTWEPLIRALEPERPLLTYDLLGHGASVNPPGERCLDDFADQLLELLDHLALQQAHVAGFSLGGLIAINFAARHAQRTRTLAILNSVYMRSDAVKAAVQARWQQVAREGPQANVEDALERWFTPSYRDAHPQQMQWIRDIFARHTHDGYLKAYSTFVYTPDDELRDGVARVRCPTLVMTSEADVGSTPEMAKAMAAAIPDARCRIVAGGLKHMAPVEAAGEYAAILGEWLAA